MQNVPEPRKLPTTIYISIMSNKSDIIVRNQSHSIFHALSFHILNVVYWRHILLIPQRTHLANSSQISVSF